MSGLSARTAGRKRPGPCQAKNIGSWAKRGRLGSGCSILDRDNGRKAARRPVQAVCPGSLLSGVFFVSLWRHLCRISFARHAPWAQFLTLQVFFARPRIRVGNLSIAFARRVSLRRAECGVVIWAGLSIFTVSDRVRSHDRRVVHQSNIRYLRSTNNTNPTCRVPSPPQAGERINLRSLESAVQLRSRV